MTYLGPSSSLSSSSFFSCAASVGGGMYHDSYTDSGSLAISDSLFEDCHASYTPNRGGGAIEDYKSHTYNSQYSYSFFTQNSATGVGYDISVIGSPLRESSLIHCFTTTAKNFFWNTNYAGYEDWLSL